MKLPINPIIILAFLFIRGTIEETVNFDPYEVLGVGRSANTDEIRKVYKKLVMKWHPDKNKSPDAEDTFIKIQQAYEILSNEDKREQYDTGGYASDTVGQWHHQSEGFHFRYSDFGQDYFNTKATGRTLSLHDFYNQVLPSSHLTPHLIYVYSTFCAQCIIWLRTTWQKAASELESLGISICTVDTTFTSRIASSLGVTRVPTIVGLYKEKVYYFKGQITKEELKFFVNSFLPTDIITTITSASVDEFLSGIEIDDKPRSILFSDKSEPTLLYTMMAIKYQHYLRFGFVCLRDQRAAEVIKHFGVSRTGPTLLVFKEDLAKPAVVLGSSEMPRGAINDILAGNKFVTVPRLTSQKVFDEMCPSPNGAVHSVRLCMVLLSDPAYADYKAVSSTLKKLVNAAQIKEEHLSEWLKFMHVHSSKQPAFARSLRKGFSLEEKEETQLFLLWRRGQSSTSLLRHDVDFLQKPYPVAEQEFQLCLRTAIEAAHLQRFQTTVSLAPLVDELAPFFLLWVLQTMVDVIEYMYHFVTNMTERGFMTVVMVTVFIIVLFQYLFSSEEKSEPKEQRRSADVTEETPKEDFVPTASNSTSGSPQGADGGMAGGTPTFRNKSMSANLHELVPTTYSSLVLSQSRGHITIVLLVDEETPEGQNVIIEYQETMKVHARDPKISLTYLNVKKYSTWYLEVRRSSSAEPPSEDADAPHDASSLHGSEFESSSHRVQSEQTIANATGTVLALNGARHWYCMFVPRGVKWGRKKIETLGAETGQETYEEALSCWMDRVREGQMPRLYVRQWPGLYLHPREDKDDDDDDRF